MAKKLAPVWIIAAGCLWGAMGLFVRKYSSFGVEAMSVVFLRALVTSAVTFVICLIQAPGQLKIPFRDMWIFAGMGIASIVFFNYCYFTAINLMSLSAAAILLYTSPVFVAVFSAVIFKERITGIKIAAMFISILGLALVTGLIGGSTEVTPLGIIFGIGSAVGYALYSIFNRYAINRGYTPLATISWSFLFAAAVSVFFADLPAIGSMMSGTPMMIPFTFLFAVTVSVLPYFLYSVGQRGTENSKAAVLASIEPAAATLIGAMVYHEYPTLTAAAGIVLVFTALVLCIDKSDKN
ncbi:MAG: DMT family transporter [Huintestinicola sp.]